MTPVFDLDLQLHDVAAFRGTDNAGTYVFCALVERADVARVLVVINDLFGVDHGSVLLGGAVGADLVALPLNGA